MSDDIHPDEYRSVVGPVSKETHQAVSNEFPTGKEFWEKAKEDLGYDKSLLGYPMDLQMEIEVWEDGYGPVPVDFDVACEDLSQEIHLEVVRQIGLVKAFSYHETLRTFDY